jgi:membrane protease YdiL (CAAX protease family)
MSNFFNPPQKAITGLTLLKLILFVFGGLFVGQFVGLIVSIPFLDIPITELGNALSDPSSYPGLRTPLFIIQGFTAICAFIIAPLLFLYLQSGKTFRHFSVSQNPALLPVILSFFLVFSFMMVNSLFIDWNMNLSFPEFMAGFERWARSKEDELEVLTRFMLETEGMGQFVLAFVVIAIIPAIGEEVLFRGVLQNLFVKFMKNPHLAIWLAGIVFSAFHLQFYGFVPRLMLGVLFGYMYWYSGSLWFPIIGHFINNGFTIIMMGLHQRELIDINIEESTRLPAEVYWPSLVLFLMLGFIYINYFRKNKEHNGRAVAESLFIRDVASGGDREIDTGR